mgnify:CR=1 FL=1
MNIIDVLKPHMVTRTYSESELITTDLSKAITLYYVQSGAVLVEGVSLQPAKDRRVGLLKPAKSFIGLEYLFIDQDTCCKSVVTAVAESEVLSISQTKLQALLEGDLHRQRSALVELMTKQLSAAYRELQVRLEEIISHNPHEQVLLRLKGVAHYIGQDHERGTQVAIKSSYLAKLSGLSEEGNRRALLKLMDYGMIAKIGTNNFLLFN